MVEFPDVVMHKVCLGRNFQKVRKHSTHSTHTHTSQHLRRSWVFYFLNESWRLGTEMQMSSRITEGGCVLRDNVCSPNCFMQIRRDANVFLFSFGFHRRQNGRIKKTKKRPEVKMGRHPSLKPFFNSPPQEGKLIIQTLKLYLMRSTSRNNEQDGADIETW